MYFDRVTPIEHDLVKIKAVMRHAIETGVPIATDSNAIDNE